MTRWVVRVVAFVLATGIGFLIGYVYSNRTAPQVQRLEQRVQSENSEVSALQNETRQLQQQIEQITKEQERLAQENETLRKAQTTQQLLTGQGGELPARPPK
jgi:peptidoglycan hydrolase CwlO-like protein